MVAVFQMTTPMATALIVALIATTIGVATALTSPSRLRISPFVPLACWALAAGAMLAMSYMLPADDAGWLIATIRVSVAVTVGVITAIVYMVTRPERSSVKTAMKPSPYTVASSPGLPAPYTV